MTAQRDLDTILAAWLDEGPTALPDATRRAIVTALPTTTQARRGRFAPWRPFDMNGFGRLAAVALVAVVAIGGLIYVTTPSIGPRPTPSPAASPSPGTTDAPTPGPTMELTSFTSPEYGYTVEHPASWTARPATESWPIGGPFDPDQPYVDRFHPTGSDLGATVLIAAQPVPDGTTGEAWMADFIADREAAGGPCPAAASAWTDATVAGAPARRIQAPCVFGQAGMSEFAEYVFVVDGTGYAISGVPSVVELMIATFQAG